MPRYTAKPVYYLIFFFCLLASQFYAQQNPLSDINYKKFTLEISSKDSVISLTDRFLKEGTVSIYLDSIEINAGEYSVNHRFGIITFNNSFKQRFIVKTRAFVIIAYKYYPFKLQDVYSRFEVLEQVDSTRTDTVRVAEIKTDFIEDIFAGSELQKSGNIFRGFTVGNNRDLTLQSGFRLQLNGKLSKDIDIVAALTDENTPIQPEGNTQKLQEIDKVFIELKSSNVTATLGDIDIQYNDKEFFKFNRKLQGAKGFFNYDKSNLNLSAALSRGSFSTNSFNGIDGIQGPYRLNGLRNEVNIIVIAGSERVYIDGIKMERGENNDYVIDYSNGQITFTNRRLITNASRIIVDFEYSDKKYSRSFLSGEATTLMLKDNIKLSLSYVRERDDRDKPIDFNLSDSDRVLLSKAGDDRLKASKSGVTFVGRDTMGIPLGSYVERIDSTNGQKFYVYSPGDTNAVYQVSFSFIGAGRGDYSSLSSSVFQYIGKNNGSYLPIIILPLPVSYQSIDLGLDFKLSKNFLFRVEASGSDFDKNLFSDADDKNNKGLALNSSIVFSNLNSNSKSMKVEAILKQRFVNKLYNPVDRLNQVEYNRIWDIQDSLLLSENTTELELKLFPKRFISISGLGGYIRRGNVFNSFRSVVDVDFKGDSLKLPFVKYNIDFVSGKDISYDYKSFWIKQNGVTGYNIKLSKTKLSTMLIAFELNGEDKTIRAVNVDTVRTESFRFYEFKPKLSIFSLFNFDVSYLFNYRIDDIYNLGSLTRQSNSFTHTFNVRFSDPNFFFSTNDITSYERKFTEAFKNLGFGNNKTLLVTSLNNFWFLNRAVQTTLFYKVSSQRTARSEVIFIKVPVGQGNYKYLGDLNSNGLQDENEFELAAYDGDYIKIIRPTDQLFPTTDLQSSASINISPARFLNSRANNGFEKALKQISFDTYLTVSEKSKDPVQKNIYLLKLSKFQNDVNTISGNNSVQQDINLFENYELFGFRVRFLQRTSLIQYYTGNERQLNIERSARVRLSFTKDLTLITDYISETRRNLAPNVVIRNWNISSRGGVSEMIYKPTAKIEASFKFETKRSNDNYPSSPTQADINNQSLRMTYAFVDKGRVRVEISRNEALLNANPLFVPFELTGGLIVGKTFLWSLNVDFRISTFIQATMNYFGRAEGKSRVIHNGTAEVRAYF